MTKPLVANVCDATSPDNVYVTLDGNVGGKEYALSIEVYGSQTAGTFPIGGQAKPYAGAQMVDVGSKTSSQPVQLRAQSGSVTLTSKTAGSITADLTPDSGSGAVDATGSWVCAKAR
jgi:hypothetical protein